MVQVGGGNFKDMSNCGGSPIKRNLKNPGFSINKIIKRAKSEAKESFRNQQWLSSSKMAAPTPHAAHKYDQQSLFDLKQCLKPLPTGRSRSRQAGLKCNNTDPIRRFKNTIPAELALNAKLINIDNRDPKSLLRCRNYPQSTLKTYRELPKYRLCEPK